MKRLRPKLEMLKEYARFRVRINGVLGSTPSQEVIEVARISMSYGFDFSVHWCATNSVVPCP